MGRALAVALHEFQEPDGCPAYRVFATARKAHDNGSLRELGLETVQLDVTDVDSVSAAVGSVVEKTGRIDVVVNNAGVMCPGPLVEAR